MKEQDQNKSSSGLERIEQKRKMKRSVPRLSSAVLAATLLLPGLLTAFVPPSPRGRHAGNRRFGRGGGGGGGDDGLSRRTLSDNEGPLHISILHSIPDDDEEFEDDRHQETASSSINDTRSSEVLRGGDSQGLVKGASATLASTGAFWGKQLQTLTSTITVPFKAVSRRVHPLFKSKAKRQEEALMEQLKTMPVRRVTIPNTTLLPTDVIQIAARRSGIVGQPLRPDRVQDFAAALQKWYNRHGYVLNSVTGATLRPETATAEISVQEHTTAQQPVGIVFLKEMIVDQETGDLLTPRQYKERHVQRRTRGIFRRGGVLDRQNLNTTFVTTENGRTRPSRIASALQLQAGKPFRWNPPRWQRVAGSGIFARILKASPQALQDGTVQLQIVATEAPARHLEYGVGKSLYTGSWEGELDFEHVNLLGGAETLALSVRRGTKEPLPSVRVRFSDDRFGMEGGYDVEAFSDYIGDERPTKQRLKIEPAEGEQQEAVTAPSSPPNGDYDTRRGATFRLRNPIDTRLMSQSVASCSIERDSSKTGFKESIGSVTLGVGPFVRTLPLGARSNVDARFLAGARVATKMSDASGVDRVRPYSAVTASTRQTFPLLTTSSSSSARPILLALKHSVTTSSRSLPRHEAKAQGIACNIRGAGRNGRISSALTGTTELRIPIQLPSEKVVQDASVVVFGDWLFAKQDVSSSFTRKSSVGLGIRKSVQGIPVQYNLCYSPTESKIKATFGLGRDFEV